MCLNTNVTLAWCKQFVVSLSLDIEKWIADGEHHRHQQQWTPLQLACSKRRTRNERAVLIFNKCKLFSLPRAVDHSAFRSCSAWSTCSMRPKRPRSVSRSGVSCGIIWCFGRPSSTRSIKTAVARWTSTSSTISSSIIHHFAPLWMINKFSKWIQSFLIGSTFRG